VTLWTVTAVHTDFHRAG